MFAVLILKLLIMRKIIKEYLEFFRKNDLKKYSKIVNQYFRKKWGYIFVLLITSCSVQNQINRYDNVRIPKNFSAIFNDKLDTIRSQYDNQIFTSSLMKDFANVDIIDYSTPIQIRIINDNLYLKFVDTNKKEFVLKYYGKLHKRRFVFYTNYKTISFPIVLVTKKMTKYSIYLSSENEIIFDNHNVNEGMLLMFGAGNSSKFNYKFKILENE